MRDDPLKKGDRVIVTVPWGKNPRLAVVAKTPRRPHRVAIRFDGNKLHQYYASSFVMKIFVVK